MSNLYRVVCTTLLGTLLCGCNALTGGATYTYIKTGPDSCQLVADTGRVLENGVTFKLDPECGVTVSAGSVKQGSNSVADVVDLVKVIKTPIITPDVKTEEASKE